MQADVWRLRADVTPLDDEMIGYDVEGSDGKIGQVEHVSFERTCVVVSTSRLFGKKFVIPASTVERVDEESRTIFVDLSKDEVENSPQYDESIGFDDACEETTSAYYADVLARRAEVE